MPGMRRCRPPRPPDMPAGPRASCCICKFRPPPARSRRGLPYPAVVIGVAAKFLYERQRASGSIGVRFLLRLSRAIDALNEQVGHLVYWLVLAAVVVSAGNAMMRYLFDMSSNAWLELQWYLFSAVFLLAAGYTLRHNEHVRIDVVIGHLPPRARAWIDLLGGLFFLLPMASVILVLSWPMFVEAVVRHEISGDAGGLLRWPVKLLIPAGFLLLLLQGLSEIIKRAAFLAGRIPDPLEAHREPMAEEFLKRAVE